MDVRPVGAGLAGTDLAQRAGPVAPAGKPNVPAPGANTQSPAFVEGAGLAGLSEADGVRLAALLEQALPAQTPARLDQLLQSALTAAESGDLARALDAVTELASAAPLRAEAVRAEPGLEPIRAPVDALLARLSQVARLDAEGRLGQAADLVAQSGMRRVPDWDAPPEVLLRIGSQLLDSGGHANFVKASQVAQVVIDTSHWAPAPVDSPAAAAARVSAEAETADRAALPAFPRSWSEIRTQASERIRILWRRAPLLVLLLAWLAGGLVGGTGSWLLRLASPEAWPPSLTSVVFDVWGLGFVALVLFGFYMRVRNVKL